MQCFAYVEAVQVDQAILPLAISLELGTNRVSARKKERKKRTLKGLYCIRGAQSSEVVSIFVLFFASIVANRFRSFHFVAVLPFRSNSSTELGTNFTAMSCNSHISNSWISQWTIQSSSTKEFNDKGTIATKCKCLWIQLQELKG